MELRNLIYCDFQDPLADKKMYHEVANLDELTATVEEYLHEYNSISVTPMNLVLFRLQFYLFLARNIIQLTNFDFDEENYF